jgi:AAA domain/Primase C terminal 2 (PriCT-2)/Bifunctional DNA primase/polymerase, N-terminal
MSEFQQYVDHGWKICRIDPGTKGPRTKGWNDLTNAVTDTSTLEGAGLMHAYSGTCALDVDDWEKAEKFLSAKGISLADLFVAKDAVQLSSGTTNRGKLIYALKTPLPSKVFADGAFELRCGTTASKTVQDVLPPSVHPSGRRYEWIGDWRRLPELPSSLHALWNSALVESAPAPRSDNPNGFLTDLRDLVFKRDPDCGYDEWIKIGMAIHFETNGSRDGLGLWDDWSAPSQKYAGFANLEQHWVSFGNSNTPVTIAFLRKTEIATADDFAAFDSEPLSELIFDQPKAKSAKIVLPRLTLDQLYTRPAPPWIIPGALPQGRIGCIYGPYSSGKTFLTVDLALSIALGAFWRGIPVKQGHALYIAAEDNYGVQARFKAAERARGVTGSSVTVIPAAPSFLDPDWKKALVETAMRPERPSVIFVDTLARVTAGADENSGKDMGPVMEFSDYLAEQTGAMVTLVHHTGKDAAKGMRGWSGMPANMDVIWAVNKENDKHELTIEKLKNAQDGMTYRFRLLPVDDSCVVEWL